MGIAAQLSEAADLRVISMEIAKEAADNASIVFKSARSQGESEVLDMSFQYLIEAKWSLGHDRWAEPNSFLFAMAIAYSRHTSCGASWT